MLGEPTLELPDKVQSGIRLRAPWGGKDWLEYRYPETLRKGRAAIYLDHDVRQHQDLMQSPITDEPGWVMDDDSGTATYAVSFENGVRMVGTLTPEANGTIACTFSIENGSDRDLVAQEAQLCMVCRRTPLFADPKLERTWIPVGDGLLRVDHSHPAPGTEGPASWPVFTIEGGNNWKRGGSKWYVADERCDASFIATESVGGGRVLGIAWESAYKVTSNHQFLCIHSDPIVPACPAGESRTVRGRVYFHEGSVEELYARARAEFGESWATRLTGD